MQCEKVQICSVYSGSDPAVRNFFFGTNGYKGVMNNSDKAVLAIKGSAIVGGLLLRSTEHGTKVIFRVGTAYVRGRLFKEAKKLEN